MKIKGSGTYTDTDGANQNVFGVGELADDKKLRKLEVSGSLSFEKISCDKISVSGKCKGDSVIAKDFSASGKVEVDSLMIEQNLEISGKPKIDFMTADEVVIVSRAGSVVKIKCRTIKIYDDSPDLFDVHNSRISIKKIDADTVELENCAVDVIRCKDAFIGFNCAIEKLFVAGECKVADDSKVGETIRT